MAPNCPVGAAACCASNAASERITACCQPLRSPTARCRPLYEGAAAAQATTAAEQHFGLQPSQLRPSEEIAAALASTMARCVLERRSLQASRAASRLRAKTPCEVQARATAPVERSEALGSRWRSCNFHKRFCNST